jgi:hypothetical protein
MARLFPGFGGAPSAPPPLPPVPTREDPAIAEAREKLRLAERRRAGRRATNLTGSEATLGNSRVARPGASPSKLLGE